MGIDNNGVYQKIHVCKLNNLWNNSNKKIYAANQISCTLKKYDDLDPRGVIEYWPKVIRSAAGLLQLLYLSSSQYELYLSSSLRGHGEFTHSDRKPNIGATSII